MKDQPCVFCGSSPINREHAWPEWLSAEFADVEGFDGFIYEARGKKWRSAKRLTHRVHAPCVACNGGWMSQLEEAAQPILRPLLHGSDERRREFTPQEQYVLAFWIAKTCMMLDLTIDSPTVFAPNDYRWLAVHRQPPHGVQITFTAIQDPPRASTYWRALSQPIPKSWIPVETPLDAAAAAKAPEIHTPAYRLTFTLGHFVAQQFGHPTLNLEGLQYTGRMGDVVDWLWPLSEDIRPVWPPESILQDGEALQVAAHLPLIAQRPGTD